MLAARHPFVKDDTDLTAADFAKYHVVLFGDPGSNKWIAKMKGKLPFKWTKQSVTLGDHTFSSKENYPALIYPNPLCRICLLESCSDGAVLRSASGSRPTCAG